MFPPNNHHHLRGKPDEHCRETLFNNYHNNQHFGQPQEYFRENSKTASTIMQDGFDVASQKPELSKKRKAEDQLIDVHGGRGGGRVVRPVAGKDKHSKVSTARGPRDRRLRLSPRTAIQFYDVQDRLGYDRPSKAIDWLIKEAKSAIDALDDAAAEINNRRFSNDEKPVSGFGNFLLDGAAAAPPPSSSTEFCASSGLLTSTCQEIVDNNTINFQAQPIILGNSQMFHQREPLQSSIINNYSPISPYFPVVGFPDGDELSSITAGATLREDGKDKNYSKFQE